MRNRLTVLILAFLALLIPALLAGCISTADDLSAVLERIEENADRLADRQDRIDDLAATVSFNPDEPKDPNDLYERHLEIGFQLQEQQAVNDRIMKDYREAIQNTGDQGEAKSLKKELSAYKLKGEGIEAARKIEGVYILIWQSIAEEKRTLGASDYTSLRKVLARNVVAKEYSEARFRELIEKKAE